MIALEKLRKSFIHGAPPRISRKSRKGRMIRLPVLYSHADQAKLKSILSSISKCKDTKKADKNEKQKDSIRVKLVKNRCITSSLNFFGKLLFSCYLVSQLYVDYEMSNS